MISPNCRPALALLLIAIVTTHVEAGVAHHCDLGTLNWPGVAVSSLDPTLYTSLEFEDESDYMFWDTANLTGTLTWQGPPVVLPFIFSVPKTPPSIAFVWVESAAAGNYTLEGSALAWTSVYIPYPYDGEVTVYWPYGIIPVPAHCSRPAFIGT